MDYNLVSPIQYLRIIPDPYRSDPVSVRCDILSPIRYLRIIPDPYRQLSSGVILIEE
jgi:hypothetical protein